MTHNLPAICEWREMAEARCLAGYGYSSSEVWSMLAALTEKMLKGAPPGDGLGMDQNLAPDRRFFIGSDPDQNLPPGGGFELAQWRRRAA
jgi:hypothetical protein